ncbi:hypothetical protein PMAYCL1PPCAC_23793, partial [Pristionchus mayeri]
IYVVDGSSRSGHSNAYMYGFWNNKRIVLYDTLLSGEEKRRIYMPYTEITTVNVKDMGDGKGMGEEEVVAVVGHELGHWAPWHTLR